MGTHNVLVKALIIAAVGSYGCAGQEKETSKRTSEAESSEQGSKQTKGVSFNFALPKDFEDSKEEEILSEESSMLEEFNYIEKNSYINVSCEDESLIDADYYLGKKLRAILEISLVHVAGENPWEKEEWMSKKDSEDLEAQILEKEEAEKDSATCKDKGKHDLLSEENEEDHEEKEDDLGEIFEFETYSIETIAVPFVCKSGATIQISNLDNDQKYVVNASLYSGHGRLKYAGSTESFDSMSGSIKLSMEEVKEPKEVSIEVVFENHKKGKKD
jgi:hypothetical protein